MLSVLPVNSYLPVSPSTPKVTAAVPVGAATSLPRTFHESSPFPPGFPYILVPLLQYPLLHPHSAAGLKTAQPVPIFYSAYPCPPSNLIIIINISADITPSQIKPFLKKETGSIPSLWLRTLPISYLPGSFYIHPHVNWILNLTQVPF